jgi:AAA domain-containing protein
MKHWDARCAALRGLVATGGYQGLEDVAAVTKLMREEGVLQYGEKTALLWGQEPDVRHVSITTALHEAHETEFLSLAKAAAADRSGAFTAREVDAAARQSGLKFESYHGKAQLKAIHTLGEGGRFGVAIGTAGAGKSAMLQVLTIAAEKRDIDVWGASLAWRQADDMVNGGIDRSRVKAFSVLLDGLKDGSIKLGRDSLLAVDELGLLGTRQGLELLRLREQHGFGVVALGDDKQCASIESGNIITLCRRTLGAEQVPEILTTVRPQTERERTIAGLIREGQPAPALDMKRSDGTAEMVPGGYDQLVGRVAALYGERLRETGKAPTISAPTNIDAHRIGVAVREERRKMGLIGPDIRIVKATDGERNYSLALAGGDHVRLFKSTGVRLESGRGGRIGRNGSVVEVVSMDGQGIKLRSLKTNAVGTAKWSDLVERDGRVHLAYGSALTVHTAQGLTSGDHIFALPAGSQAITGATRYTAMTRHRLRSYLLTSEVAERAAVRASRPINDPREVTLDDKWAMVAKSLVNQPVKDLAVNMAERVQTLKRGMVKQFQQQMHPAEQRKRQGLSPTHAPEKAQTLRVQQTHVLERIRDVAMETMRHIQQQAHELSHRLTRQHRPRLGR